MYRACMHTSPPARPASRAAAPSPKVALLALEDNQSSAEALELNTCRESCLSNFFNTMLSQVLTLSDGTLSGLGKNHKSAHNPSCAATSATFRRVP